MPCSILVVDDSVAILHYMESQLKALGVDNIELCSDPTLVMPLLNERAIPFDGIFLDLNMPKMDGMSLLSELASSTFEGGVGIISALEPRVLGLASDLAKRSHLYFIGSIPKPIKNHDLALAVMKISQPMIYHRKKYALTEDQLDTIFEEGKVMCYFQPQVNLRNNKIIGMECLIRIDNANHGMISAADFVPYAEENGKIDFLFKLMLPSALSGFQHCLNELEDKNITLSLNISVKQLEDSSFPDYIEEQCRLFSLPHDRIMIEVTESQVLDHGRKLETLNRLKIKGFQLSLDDFGTGFTNFNQLKSLPFNEVKVDRELCHGISDDKSNILVVETMVKVGKEQGFKVLAEGVEFQEDMDLLLRLGVNIFQGFNISRPKPEKEVIRWMRAWEKIANKYDEKLSNSKSNEPR